ncbi:MAG: sulfatase-like hydrolase/transferase [Kiritimatiellaeota bacterium]|nr:sulfatase-like hydrolase/transferase [Kiritimatiellota bacterium]
MPSTSPPNIVILYSDQHRADMVGWSNRQTPTPNLDRLAGFGAVFDRCYCQYPVCTPSRMSLLTGQYVHTHGVHCNNAGLHPRRPTFARVLREHGYATACIGKMHFFPTYAPYGFDHMELAEQDGPGRFEDDYHRFLVNTGVIDLHDLVDQRHEFRKNAPAEYWETFGARASDLPEELHSTSWIGDRAEAYLRAAEPPFCAWIGFIKPHHPFDPPQAWLDRIDPDVLDLPPDWTEVVPEQDAGKPGYFDVAPLTPDTLRHIMAHYYATISHIDFQIGRVLRVLEERGLDNTVVIYTADHGEFMGFHHLLLKGGYLYDPLVRVPLAITDLSGARHWARGIRSDALVESVDVTATVLDAAGVPAPPGMQGKGLAPVLTGQSSQHRQFVFAQNGGMSMTMVRTSQWKLIESASPRDRMLFDLAADPSESVNLYESADHAGVRLELTARLVEHLCRHCPRRSTPATRPTTAAQRLKIT